MCSSYLPLLPCLFQSPVTVHETASVHDETSSSGNKDDEEDDDDESDDRLDAHKYDPERLKAFNVSILGTELFFLATTEVGQV